MSEKKHDEKDAHCNDGNYCDDADQTGKQMHASVHVHR